MDLPDIKNQPEKCQTDQQIARLRNQVQVWQSKWENNQKILSDYTNEVQQMQRQVADIPTFMEDTRELPEQLYLLKKAIKSKLVNYQGAQQHLEEKIQNLEQELEIAQYKLKLIESQQCSDQQFQEKMHSFTEEMQQLHNMIEEKNQENKQLLQQIELYKQSELETSKSNEETKNQLNILRQNFSKVKQQHSEVLQEKAVLMARVSEQNKTLKEKAQEITKQNDLIQELEQYNVMMEESLSGALDQYKIQAQQLKSAYEKEKKERIELQKQLKTSEQNINKNIDLNQTQESQIIQCQCKEKVQEYQQKILELEFQISELQCTIQIQQFDKQIQRNSIAQIRSSILLQRESITNLPQNNQNFEYSNKLKELEEKILSLTDERIKVSKDYQIVLERALQANTQYEQKYNLELKDLTKQIHEGQCEIILLKQKIGDMLNAAIEIGGAKLVDRMQLAVGLKE